MKVSLLSLFAAGASALSFDADGAKNRPVSKVITLLKDMQKQLEKEAEQDEAVYDKMACWCKTNDKEKTQAIKDAEAHIAMLNARIEENIGKSATLNQEIKNLEREVGKNTESLAQATELRRKALSEFTQEEKDLLQSIQALKNALVVLKKHHSLTQQGSQTTQGVSQNDMITIAAMLKHQMKHHSDLLDDVIAPSQQRMISGFIQSAEGTDNEDSSSAPAYQAQSGEIFGILQNMQETFEGNLSQAQKDEMANQKAFEDLKEAKEAEIKAGQEQIDTKTSEMAAANEQVANDKQDADDTMNNLSADEKFLMMLKEKCAMTDAEWEQRQKTRTEEIGAVSEALKFLSSDDAHDLFTKTFNFVQVSKQVRIRDTRISKAADVLKAAAEKVNDPKLGMLAQKMRLDAFTRVKKAIDDMVAALTKEGEDEIKHRDFCVDGLHENEKDTSKTTRDRDDLQATMEQLQAEITTIKGDIKDLSEQIAEMQVQLKRAGEDREIQNKDFQTTVQDQRATMKLLTQAANVLKSFYEKSTGGVAFLATKKQGPPPPAGFDSYQNNRGNTGVIAMITQIIHDAKMMEQEAIHDEEEAQKTYEVFVQETNDSTQEKQRAIVSKKGAVATAEGDLATAHKEHEGKEIDLEQLANAAGDLHKSCDFTLKNFDIRQEARSQEIEALQQAKAILSGANFNAFLQRKD
jgi:chromosome segregation ATPase